MARRWRARLVKTRAGDFHRGGCCALLTETVEQGLDIDGGGWRVFLPMHPKSRCRTSFRYVLLLFSLNRSAACASHCVMEVLPLVPVTPAFETVWNVAVNLRCQYAGHGVSNLWCLDWGLSIRGFHANLPVVVPKCAMPRRWQRRSGDITAAVVHIRPDRATKNIALFYLADMSGCNKRPAAFARQGVGIAVSAKGLTLNSNT